MESLASELIWDLYKLLCIAKSKTEVNLYKDNNYLNNNNYNSSFSWESNEEEKMKSSSFSSPRRKTKYLSKEEIDPEFVNFKHEFNIKDYKRIPNQLQILLLWPGSTFAEIYKSYIEMKESIKYNKMLFKELEDNTNLVLKENFYKEFTKEILWSQKFNKVINDSNQYLLNQKENNIF